MNFTKINKYLDKLYKNNTLIGKKQYKSSSELKDFIPIIDDDVARLLSIIVQMSRSKKILEIGTGIGFSTISMARAIKKHGGKITTIEFDEASAIQAKKNFTKAGLSKVIEIKIGDAQKIILQMKDKFDLIFQDADKRLYPCIFKDCIRLLKSGGILIAEDTLFPVINLSPKYSHLIAPIDKFNRLVADNPDLESTILPIGDGLTIAIKKH